jgi:hypothetical protein
MEDGPLALELFAVVEVKPELWTALARIDCR